MRRLASLSIALVSVMLLTSCSLLGGIFGDRVDTAQVVRDTMAHIIEALNDHDAAALRAMFTDYAIAMYSAEIDEGVTQLLSLFPDGVIWRDDGTPAGSGSGLIGDGKKTWLAGKSDVVSSGEKEYTRWFSIFTENTFDPDNVGIFQMGADFRSDSRVSGAELASCGSIDSTDARAGAPPGVVIGDSGAMSHDRAVAILDALNARDTAALKSMFTEYARTEYSAQIDEGLEYLLSLFEDGEVTWGEAAGGSAVCERIMGDATTVLLPTYYTVRSGGVDYRLFFADYIENTIDPNNVGIYAIGAALAAECGRCVPESELNSWANEFYVGSSSRPGIFVHQNDKADAQMEQIATALNSHDAAALKSMFSTEVLGQSAEIDDGLDYLFSLFPDGGITWTQDPAENNPVDSSSYIEDGRLSEWLLGNYKLSADGNEYWLYFSSVTTNEMNPDNVGLEKLGVTPWIEERSSNGMSGPSEKFYAWVHVTTTDTNLDNQRLGIYLPH